MAALTRGLALALLWPATLYVAATRLDPYKEIL